MNTHFYRSVTTIFLFLLGTVILHAQDTEQSAKLREQVNQLLNEFELKSQLTQDYKQVSRVYVDNLQALFDQNARVFVDVVPSDHYESFKPIGRYLKEAQKWYNQGYTVLQISQISLGDVFTLPAGTPYHYAINLGFVKSSQVLDATKEIHFAEESYNMVLGLDANYANPKILLIDTRPYPASNRQLQMVLFPNAKAKDTGLPQPFKKLRVKRKGLFAGLRLGIGLADLDMAGDAPFAAPYTADLSAIMGLHAGIHLDYYFNNWLGVSSGLQFFRLGANMALPDFQEDQYTYPDLDAADTADRTITVRSGKETQYLHSVSVPLRMCLKFHLGNGRFGVLLQPGADFRFWSLNRSRISGEYKTTNSYDEYGGVTFEAIEDPFTSEEARFNARYGLVNTQWDRAASAGYDWEEQVLNLQLGTFLFYDMGIDKFLQIGLLINASQSPMTSALDQQEYHIIDEQGNYQSLLAGAKEFSTRYAGVSIGFFTRF